MKRRREVRQSVAVSAVLVALVFLLPLALVVPREPSLFSAGKTAEETECPPFAPGQSDGAVTLRVLQGDTVTQMDLGTYLVGVVRAEMPASFALEALKAQAAAARTYTLSRMSSGSHGDTADVCTDPACCQAYKSEEAAAGGWGQDAAAYEAKVRRAVQETDGQVILYGGEPILAVFHAASAGLTRSAGEVWTNDLPYLQPVESPEQEEGIPDYYSRAEFTPEEFQRRMAAYVPEADFSAPPQQWITDADTDAAGSVRHVKVGGVSVRGATVRSALGLRSACFTWDVQGKTLVFYVTGYGHGVGMSQYGAQAMALSGADYREILTHYYTGVEIGGYEGA